MCLKSSLLKVVELTPTPPGNNFVSEDRLNLMEERYPLDLYFCKNCHHVQLGHVVDPRILYQNNYSYVSSTSRGFLNHLQNYAQYMINRFKLKPLTLIVDIGSNDGSCLKYFKEKGMTVLGVDPAKNIANIANRNGIETIPDFFSYDLAKKLRHKYGPAGLITSHNACAHIDDMDDIMSGVNHLLDDDGVLLIEVGYFMDVYNNVWFDTIYHEHLDYHTVEPFQYLFKRFGLEIISVMRIEPQGGSIRIISQKCGGKNVKDSSDTELIRLENDAGFTSTTPFINFNEKINKSKINLVTVLQELKNSGRNIAGYGAATKATTLLEHFGINKNILDFIVDDNPLKQNLYTPGTHIKVLPVDAIYENNPDYILILAWNFSDSIMRNNMKYIQRGGKFIIPMPEVRIINNKMN